MAVISGPPGIPSASRLAGWIGGTTSPASLTRAEFAAGYVAFGYFKLAVVLESIYARYLQHQTVGEGFEHKGLAIPTLVARAHQVLDADD
jgi:hypothetical protein